VNAALRDMATRWASFLPYTETPSECRLVRTLNYRGGEIAARSRRSADSNLL